MLRLLPLFLLCANALGSEPLGFTSTPLGTAETPLILRTFVPDPGLDPAVFANHGKAAPSPKYNPGKGTDVKGEYEMLKLIPAAIAVNHGPALSYVFDTTECRVLYAWQGGFLDMYPYWGDQKDGQRRSFDYQPRLLGNLFYLAKPVKTERPTFIGYDLSSEGVPTFLYKLGETTYAQTITPSATPLSYQATTASGDQTTSQTITGTILSRHQGYDRTLKIDQPNAKAGEQVYLAYGCIACHSADGSLGHGPSLGGLFGKKRAIEGSDELVTADAAYIRESILSPNAKTAKGFPPNYMPPYQLNDKELESVTLFMQSLSEEASPE